MREMERQTMVILNSQILLMVININITCHGSKKICQIEKQLENLHFVKSIGSSFFVCGVFMLFSTLQRLIHNL